MNAWVGRFHYLDQLIMAQLSEDWLHDFDDGWEAAEAFIVEADDEYLLNIKTNIATLRQAYPSPEARFDLYHLRGVFRNSAGFQMWLTDLDRRITQAIAGNGTVRTARTATSCAPFTSSEPTRCRQSCRTTSPTKSTTS